MPLLRQPQIIALTVSSLLLMEQLDGTILSTALPSIAQSLHVDPVAASVSLTSYIVGLAIFIPASGAVADEFGSRTTLLGAITIFIFCSVLCGQAVSLPMLAAGRMLQGVGGALMVPVGRLVLLRSVAKSELLGTMMWMMLPATLGPMLGPVLGGFITSAFSWRWTFYINVPVGILGLFMTWRYIPQIREPSGKHFDRIGMLQAGGGLALMSFAAEMISHNTKPYWLSAGLLLAGAGLFATYFRHMKHHPNPLLDFSLLTVPTFRLSVTGGAASRIAVGALPFLLPSLLQIGFGLNPAQSGLVTFAAPIGAIFSRLYVIRLFRRYGFRTLMMLTGSGAAVTFALIAFFRPGWPIWPLTIVLICSGAVQAIQFSAYNSIAYADLPENRMSAATSFYSTFQQVMLSAGICIAALAVTTSRIVFGHTSVTAFDFDAGFLVTGLISLLAIPAAGMLSRNAGAAVSGYSPGTSRDNAHPMHTG
ncbi:MFS transporter [Acetobacter oeni]|uniref:MFS transporter n=1 Tax=Acetobacter oeni TaxID=304077 RepID=A0A511XMY1_9PROT|nr:MFS transporter [Acetobacter oeni]MBB3881500.1 EmrB/QacA subfamily drug resistance transporter [Acetobacter oeni]NHO18364.1 MFS transporter [Acetobacter oeni]GBR10816.1 major facilitator superfamily multidrug resistance transporter [Acetobacter oeni LMG 21952]GEN64286.1 MFS transporter [Acetobacter oeni]